MGPLSEERMANLIGRIDSSAETCLLKALNMQFFRYTYDAQWDNNHIEDGGRDMYDTGNYVSV